jgi:hypothetical protein
VPESAVAVIINRSLYWVKHHIDVTVTVLVLYAWAVSMYGVWGRTAGGGRLRHAQRRRWIMRGGTPHWEDLRLFGILQEFRMLGPNMAGSPVSVVEATVAVSHKTWYYRWRKPESMHIMDMKVTVWTHSEREETEMQTD